MGASSSKRENEGWRLHYVTLPPYNKKAELSQRWPRDAHCVWDVEIFGLCLRQPVRKYFGWAFVAIYSV